MVLPSGARARTPCMGPFRYRTPKLPVCVAIFLRLCLPVSSGKLLHAELMNR